MPADLEQIASLTLLAAFQAAGYCLLAGLIAAVYVVFHRAARQRWPDSQVRPCLWLAATVAVVGVVAYHFPADDWPAQFVTGARAALVALIAGAVGIMRADSRS